MKHEINPKRLEHMIPVGDYCYEIVGELLYRADTGMPYHRIKMCPFFAGQRPDNTYCYLNSNPEDWMYNVDACKGCGINQPAEELNEK